ncbi:DivIVA domain-containing protein [Tellurirhabdus rosea]|uniref:DivIVA domain-containing protein n=1 Tax=Tellurirhabdus rosea TaxID=2674997 RepID=UPI0022586361|nr:DivIVA domain-containing protein [Tellurirhabdus rosea]
MKITPIEIRQHTFEKALRGYRTDEVEAFLASLSQEWERVLSEQKMLKMQLELAEKELNKLKEIEHTLFKTLKIAEDNSTQMRDQAERASEQLVMEAKTRAEQIEADARKKSALMMQDAENQARFLKDSIANDLRSMEHDFKAMERYRDNLVSQVRTLASNAMDSIERFERKYSQQSMQGKLDELTAQAPADDTAAPAIAAEADDFETVLTTNDTPETPTSPDSYYPEAAAVLDEDPVMAQATEAGEAGLPVVEPIEEPTPPAASHDPDLQPVPEEQSSATKTGGSFFDQI